MSRLSCVWTCLTVMPLVLAGCSPLLPPEYSPHYSYMPSTTSRQHYVLVPNACLTPDPTDTAIGPHLPPGCANASNLEHMAERKRDLVEGRRLGPAPAATSARAAQRYLDGPTGQLGGAVGTPNITTAPTSTTEPAGAPAQTPSPAAAPVPPPIQVRN